MWALSRVTSVGWVYLYSLLGHEFYWKFNEGFQKDPAVAEPDSTGGGGGGESEKKEKARKKHKEEGAVVRAPAADGRPGSSGSGAGPSLAGVPMDFLAQTVVQQQHMNSQLAQMSYANMQMAVSAAVMHVTNMRPWDVAYPIVTVVSPLASSCIASSSSW